MTSMKTWRSADKLEKSKIYLSFIYIRICDMIEDLGNTSDVRERLSTTYGVNRRSVLDDVRYFDVCKCFPEDV
jgi:hypothetical protein